jgi:hypothetical protein
VILPAVLQESPVKNKVIHNAIKYLGEIAIAGTSSML